MPGRIYYNTLKLVLKDDPEHGTTIYSRVE